MDYLCRGSTGRINYNGHGYHVNSYRLLENNVLEPQLGFEATTKKKKTISDLRSFL